MNYAKFLLFALGLAHLSSGTPMMNSPKGARATLRHAVTDVEGFLKSFQGKGIIFQLCLGDRVCMTKAQDRIWYDGLQFEKGQDRVTKETFDKAVERYAEKTHSNIFISKDFIAKRLKSFIKPYDGHITITSFRDQLLKVEFDMKTAVENGNLHSQSLHHATEKLKNVFKRDSCPLKEEKQTLDVNGYQLPINCHGIQDFFDNAEAQKKTEAKEVLISKRDTFKKVVSILAVLAVVGFILVLATNMVSMTAVAAMGLTIAGVILIAPFVLVVVIIFFGALATAVL